MCVIKPLKIAVTGSTGLVGSRIIELLKEDFNFIPLRVEDGIDITDNDIITKKLGEIDYDLLLHLAAYTNVDGAEINKKLAHDINVLGTKNLTDVCQKNHKKMVYISTGFVFDGTKPPYDETSKPNPQSFYAQTKYEGEQVVAGHAMIVRFDYPYRKEFTPKSDFVNTIKTLLQQKQSLKMITDSTITPTFIDDIAYGLKHLFNHYSPEIFHLVGNNFLSPYQAGKLIADIFGLDGQLIQPINYADYYRNRSTRPQYASLISKKNNFYKMHTFEQGLNMIIKDVKTL